jgi:hypothetical protein
MWRRRARGSASGGSLTSCRADEFVPLHLGADKLTGITVALPPFRPKKITEQAVRATPRMRAAGAVTLDSHFVAKPSGVP